MRNDDDRRHLSKWYKCPKCGIDVMAKDKPKLCETCKQEADYKRRKEKNAQQ